VLAIGHGHDGAIATLFDVERDQPVHNTDRRFSLTGWAGVLAASATYAIGATEANTLVMWSTANRELIRTFEGHSSKVLAAATNEAADLMVSASDDGTAILWELSSGRIRHVLRGHTGSVFAVALSPDARLVVTGGPDNTVRLWDAETGSQLAVFGGHDFWVNAVAVVNYGRQVLSGSEDKTLILWDIAADAPRERLFLDAKVSCMQAAGAHVIVGDRGGALHFFRVDEVP
jgi:WD40 repeat protein